MDNIKKYSNRAKGCGLHASGSGQGTVMDFLNMVKNFHVEQKEDNLLPNSCSI